MLDNFKPYSSDPFTDNYGAINIFNALHQKNGQRYLKYRSDWEKAGQDWLPEFPLNLVFDLVDQCNLACPQCLRAPDLAKDYKDFILTSKYLDKKIIKRYLKKLVSTTSHLLILVEVVNVFYIQTLSKYVRIL